MKKYLLLLISFSSFCLEQPQLVPVDHTNMHIYLNLAQGYEAEFSPLTKKFPNEFGIFYLDTIPGKEYSGFLLYLGKIPIGFCVADIESDVHDVAEFYIIPRVRKQGYGKFLAFALFDRYPGAWYVREIENANNAIAFWRKIIKEYTNSNFSENVVEDSYWGIVMRQEFSNKNKK